MTARERDQTEEIDRCCARLARLAPDSPEDYRRLAAQLAAGWSLSPPPRVGLSGGQGTGKSTLSRLLGTACESFGIRVRVLSLDDFYRTRAERIRMAAEIHPLFETRGPPGTHDVAWLARALAELATGTACEVPHFDKGRDERGATEVVQGPFDTIVFEGWCVGAAPFDRAKLAEPVNALEALEDPDCIWRTYQADQLESNYSPLWEGLNDWIQLRAPDLAHIRRWRLEQENDRPPEERMGAQQIERFIQHYERLTREMAAAVPRPGQLTVELDPSHAIRRIHRARAAT